MSEPAPSLTRIDVVVDTLIELASGIDPALQVLDGPHVGEILADVIVVGLSENPERPGYTTSVSRLEGFGRPRLEENWTVRCLLSVMTGDSDIPAMRARAVAIITALDTALRDAHHLEGVWDRARFGSEAQWVPIQYEQGTVVNVLFTVEGTSLL